MTYGASPNGVSDRGHPGNVLGTAESVPNRVAVEAEVVGADRSKASDDTEPVRTVVPLKKQVTAFVILRALTKRQSVIWSGGSWWRS